MYVKAYAVYVAVQVYDYLYVRACVYVHMHACICTYTGKIA